MNNLGDSKNLTKEELEIERLDLEIKKKELELRKKELMFQRSGEVVVGKEKTSEEINRLKMKEELELRRNGELNRKEKENEEEKAKEISKPKDIDLEKSLEKVNADVENKTENNSEIKNSFTNKEIARAERKGLLVVATICILTLAIPMCVIASKKIKEDIEFYKNIPFILNPEDYRGKSFLDIWEMYGDPDDPNNKYYAGENGWIQSYLYDMGDYNIRFAFEHGMLDYISYEPDGGYRYKNTPKDAFYLFGLDDEKELFEVFPDTFGVYISKGHPYLTQIKLEQIEEKNKTARDVVLRFPIQFMEREVFESDVSEVELIYDLKQYLGMYNFQLYDLFGSELLTLGEDEDNSSHYYVDRKFYQYRYEVPIGTIRFDTFGPEKIIDDVSIEFNSPMKYIESPQEAMVMFGVEPDTEGIYLDNYWTENGYFNENYKNIDGENKDVYIRGIDLENKTFSRLSFYMWKED